MIYYLIVYAFIAFSFLVFGKNSKKALLFSVVLICILSSLRKYTVGVDTVQYVVEYEKIGLDSTWDFNNFRFEPGFYYLCKLLYLISSNSQILIVFTSVIFSVAIYKFIHKFSKDYFLSLYLFLTLNFFFSFMNTMRETIAISILLFGLPLLFEKKYFKFILIVLISSLFHKVGLVSFLFLGYPLIKNRRLFIFVMLTLTTILFVFYRQFFNAVASPLGYSGYLDGKFGTSNYFGALLTFLEMLVILSGLYFYLVSRRIEILNDKYFFFYTYVSAVYLMFLTLVMRINIFNRISGFFGVFSIVIIPYCLNRVNFKKDKFFISIIISIISVSSFAVISYFRPEWMGCIPYKFFFES